MTGLDRDLRSSWRFLTSKKSWTAVAIISLALGIGANTVVFSIVESVLFRPFPYQDPDRIVLRSGSLNPEEGRSLSVPDLEDIRARAETLDGLGWYQATADQSPGVEPAVPVSRIGPGVLEVLGVHPVLGRTFTESDEGTSRVILGYGFWQSRYGGAPSVLGETLDVNSEPHEIIGIMPRTFFFPEPGVEFWLPISVGDFQRTSRDASSFRAIARLRAGKALETARAEMAILSQQLSSEYSRRNHLEIGLLTVYEVVLGDHEEVLFMLLGAVGFVLLIACVNVANLLLARGVARQKELTLRATLGARRTTLIRGLLMESLLLSSGAGLVSLVLGYAGVQLVPALGLVDVPRIDNASMNWSVVAFALAVSVATGLVSGLLPALRVSRVDLTSALKTGTQSSHHSGNPRLQDFLVVAELGVALVLLVGAGLLVRSSVELGRIDWGFDAEGAAVLSTRWPGGSFALGDGVLNQRLQFAETALERIGNLNDVEAVSAGVTVPLASGRGFATAERVVPDGGVVNNAILANRTFVTRDYFRVLGIRVNGREFDDRDTAEGQRAVILSEGLSSDLFPGQDPLGKTIHFATPVPEADDGGGPRSIMIQSRGGIGTLTINGGQTRDFEITGETAHVVIGVAEDVRMSGDLAVAPAPSLYLDYRQATDLGLESDILLSLLVQPGTIVIRSDNLSPGLVDRARSILVELNSEISFFEAGPLEDLVSEAIGGTGSNKLMLVLGIVFGAIALVLASAGIYGVMSHAVSQRNWEIGIRMAVGATPGGILAMVLKRALVLATLGLGLGLVGAWATSRLLENALYGIDTTDTFTFGSVALCLLVVAIAAGLVPARRASRVDPLIATRSE